MNDVQMYIVIDPQIRFGKPCINGTRITVGDILQWLSSGMTEQEIIDDYPELQNIHIRAALAFTAEETVDFIDNFYQYSKELLNTYYCSCDIVSHIDDQYLESIEEIKRTYGMLEKDTFNIFEPLENYHKEAFHDIVLMQILDPKTKEIGNIEYLRAFCKLLSEKTNYVFGSDVIVEKPKGRRDISKIDLLIYDSQNAIIVENKINNARNMPNQLARYYKYATEEKKLKVLAIAYILPVYNSNKSTELEKYDKEYAEQTEEVKKLVVPIPIISTKKDKDFCHGFLEICSNIKLENIEADEKARVYIQQYSELLKLKGGNKMIIDVQKEMLKKLYENEESVKKMNSVLEIWDYRHQILGSMIKEVLDYEKDDEDENYIVKQKGNIWFYFWCNNKVEKKDGLWFGIWYNKKTPKEIRNKILKIFKEKDMLIDIEDNEVDQIEGKLIELKIPVKVYIKKFVEMCKEIEKEITDVVN